MKFISRIIVLLALVLMPAITSAQATPQAAEPLANGKPSIFAMGIGAPATFLDQRGNEVMSITLTNIERNWEEYDTYSKPDAGKEYVLLTFEITNLTSRPADFSPYTLTLVDSMGMGTTPAYIYDNEDIWSDDISVGPGETVEGSMAFGIYADLDPVVIMWQPEWDSYIFIYLGDV